MNLKIWDDIWEILELGHLDARDFAEENAICGDKEDYERCYKESIREHLIEIRDLMASESYKRWEDKN